MKHIVRTLFSRGGRRRLTLALIGSTLVSLMETVSMAAIAPLITLFLGSSTDSGPLAMISDLLGNPPQEQLILILGITVVVGFIIKDVATIGFRWWMLMFVMREQSMTSARLLQYYLRAPFSLHLGRSSADLIRTMGTSVGQVYSLGVLGLVSAATEIIGITLIGVMLMLVMPIPTLVAFAYFGVAVWLFDRLLKPRAIAVGERRLSAQAAGYRAAFHALGGVKEIKLRGAEERFIGNYREIEMENARAGGIASFLGELPRYLLEILFIVGIAIMFGVSSSTGAEDEVFVMLALLGAAGFRILPSLSRIVASMSNVRVGAPAVADVVADLDAAKEFEKPIPPDAAAPIHLDKELTLDSVTFRYRPDGPDVLDAIDLSIPAGASVALVGSSGAGKSTLVDLILGFHHPTRGEMRVGSSAIDADNVRAWQRNLAMVPQDVYLLDATLRENIVFDGDAIDEERLRSAVALAQLEDLVDSLPDGLETQVGERGSRLSGGQRQRVGIARALYRQPELLILDEATSALDNETEHHIARTIRSLHGRVTIVIVAHRLSTVRDVDMLAYLKDGKVAASGTFEQVRRTNAEFARQVELGTLDPPTRDSSPGAETRL